MFGRRRHVAAAPATPAPQLSDEQIFELVHRTIDEFVGTRGEWTVIRRSSTDTDAIFRNVLTHSVATDIVTALREATARLEAGQPSADADTPTAAPGTKADADANARGEHSADPHSADEHAAQPHRPHEQLEPAAFSWKPAPITVWADLRKPVTGEIPVAPQGRLVA